MGFSTIAAGVVLITGTLLIGTMVLNATFDAQRTVMRAQDEDHELRSRELQTAATISSAQHTGSNLRIWTLNTGSTTLDASRVVVFVDGVWFNPQIVERTVDGKTTDVWAPGEELFLRLNIGTGSRDRAYLVLETGAGLGAAI